MSLLWRPASRSAAGPTARRRACGVLRRAVRCPCRSRPPRRIDAAEQSRRPRATRPRTASPPAARPWARRATALPAGRALVHAGGEAFADQPGDDQHHALDAEREHGQHGSPVKLRMPSQVVQPEASDSTKRRGGQQRQLPIGGEGAVRAPRQAAASRPCRRRDAPAAGQKPARSTSSPPRPQPIGSHQRAILLDQQQRPVEPGRAHLLWHVILRTRGTKSENRKKGPCNARHACVRNHRYTRGRPRSSYKSAI